jgi:hypothetical protein
MCGCALATGPDESNYTRLYCPECGWNWYDPPVPVTLVLVTTDEGTVYTRRSRSSGPLVGRLRLHPRGERARTLPCAR